MSEQGFTGAVLQLPPWGADRSCPVYVWGRGLWQEDYSAISEALYNQVTLWMKPRAPTYKTNKCPAIEPHPNLNHDIQKQVCLLRN